MRIVFITPWYPDEKQEHAGIFIETQAQAFAVKHEVLVIATHVDYSKFRLLTYTVTRQVQRGVHEYRVTVFRSIPVFNQLVYIGLTTWAAYKILKGKKVDIIHSFIGYPGAILGWLIGWVKGTSVVHTEHTRLINNYRSLWHKVLTRFGMRKAKKITAVSTWLAKQISDDVEREVAVIPNMIDVSRFKLSERPPIEVFQIGFLGGLNTNVKGLDLLLEAFSTVDFPCHLHIGGAGKLLDVYKMQAKKLGIADRCTFYGFIKVADVPAYFQRLHAFVCSSRFETFNVSLIEAMATGIPVVSTKCGGPEDFVTPINGYLVQDDAGENMASTIVRLKNTYDVFNPLLIRKYVINTFSISMVEKSIQELYNEVIQ